MDKTAKGLLDTQLAALRDNHDKKEENAIILEIVKLLLENVSLSDEALNKDDKMAIRKLFASYAQIGKSVNEFYSDAKPFLDPVAATGKIGKAIEDATETISRNLSDYETLQEQEAVLLAREEELLETEKKINSFRETINRLQEMSAISDDEIKSYEGEIQHAKEILDQKESLIAFYKAVLFEDDAAVNGMKGKGSASLHELIESIDNLKEHIDADIRSLENNLKTIVLAEEIIRDAVLKKQNKRV